MKEFTNENLKEVDDVKMFIANIEWVTENTVFIPENRCHCLDESELESCLVTKFDYIKFLKRTKFYEKNIFNVNPVWEFCCPMKLYFVDNKYYIVDGQGRLFSALAYNDNPKNTNKITDIPVMIYYNKTYGDMIQDMIRMNCFSKNWSTSDLFRYHCLSENDPSYYNNIRKVQDELGVAEYTAKLILFGYHKASHRDNNVNSLVYSKYKDFIFETFKKFYNGTVASCNGNKTQINAIKKQDCAQALYKIISNIILVCEKNNVSYDRKIDKSINILISYISNLDRQFAFKQTLGGKQAAIASYFAKSITNKTKDEYIRQAMKKVA